MFNPSVVEKGGLNLMEYKKLTEEINLWLQLIH